MEKLFPALLLAMTLVCSRSFAVSDRDYRSRCDEKKDATACFEAGFRDFKIKDPKHQKSAIAYFKKACSFQKKKKRCTTSETKNAARSYYVINHLPPPQKKDPTQIASNVRIIKAPKLQRSTSSSTTPYTPRANDHLQMTTSASTAPAAEPVPLPEHMPPPPPPPPPPQALTPGMGPMPAYGMPGMPGMPGVPALPEGEAMQINNGN